MNKLNILIDMDGITVDIVDKWLELYRESIPEDKIFESDITHYDMIRFVKYPKVLLNLLDTPGFFYNLPPMPGALEYFDKINQIADVNILTQPSGKHSFADKIDWIKKYLPNYNIKRTIFAHDKYKISGDILFDDNPNHLQSWSNNNINGKTITIDFPFNKDVKTTYRFKKENAWENVYKTILKLQG